MNKNYEELPPKDSYRSESIETENAPLNKKDSTDANNIENPKSERCDTVPDDPHVQDIQLGNDIEGLTTFNIKESINPDNKDISSHGSLHLSILSDLDNESTQRATKMKKSHNPGPSQLLDSLLSKPNQTIESYQEDQSTPNRNNIGKTIACHDDNKLQQIELKDFEGTACDLFGGKKNKEKSKFFQNNPETDKIESHQIDVKNRRDTILLHPKIVKHNSNIEKKLQVSEMNEQSFKSIIDIDKKNDMTLESKSKVSQSETPFKKSKSKNEDLSQASEKSFQSKKSLMGNKTKANLKFFEDISKISMKVHNGAEEESFNNYYCLYGNLLQNGSCFKENSIRFVTENTIWCYDTELIFEEIEDWSSGKKIITNKKLVNIATKGNSIKGEFTHVTFTKNNIYVIDKTNKSAAMVNTNATFQKKISTIFDTFEKKNVKDIHGFEAYNDELLFYCDSYSVHILVCDKNDNKINMNFVPKKNLRNSPTYDFGGANDNAIEENEEYEWKHYNVKHIFAPQTEDVNFIDQMCLHHNENVGGGLFLYLSTNCYTFDDHHHDEEFLESKQLLVYFKGIDQFLKNPKKKSKSGSNSMCSDIQNKTEFYEQGDYELFFEDYFNGVAEMKVVKDYLLIRTIHNKLRVFDILSKSMVYKLENEDCIKFVSMNLFIKDYQLFNDHTVKNIYKNQNDNDDESKSSDEESSPVKKPEAKLHEKLNQDANQLANLKKYLVLSDIEGVISMIDIDNNEIVDQETDNISKIQSINYSSDRTVNNLIFSIAKDASLNVYELSTLNHIHNLKNLFYHRGRIYSIKTTFDSQFVYTSDSKGYIKKFCLNDGMLIKDFGKVHQGAIFTMAFTCDNKYFFSADSRGTMKQFSIQDQIVVQEYPKIHQSSIWSITVTADNQFIFTSSSDGEVKQFDIEKRSLYRDIGTVSTGIIYSIACSSDSESLFISNDIGDVKQFEVKTGTMNRHFRKIHHGEILSICCSEDNKYLFTSDHKGEIKMFSIADGMLVSDWGKWHKGREILMMECSEDNKYLVTCDNDGYIYMNNINPQTQLLDYGQVHQDKVRSQSLTRNSKYCITSDQSGIIKKFLVKQEKLFLELDLNDYDNVDDDEKETGSMSPSKIQHKDSADIQDIRGNVNISTFTSGTELVIHSGIYEIKLSDYLIIADDKGNLKLYNAKTERFESTFSRMFPKAKRNLSFSQGGIGLIMNNNSKFIDEIPEGVKEDPNHEQ